MSYCRFSSNNWKSDVYVYEGDGFITHIAVNKRLFAPIPCIPYGFADFLKYEHKAGVEGLVYPNKFYTFIAKYVWGFMRFWNNSVHMKCLRMIPIVNIKLEHAGETFRDPTAKDCAIRLEYLRKLGYNIPQHAINVLLSESDHVVSNF